MALGSTRSLTEMSTRSIESSLRTKYITLYVETASFGPSVSDLVYASKLHDIWYTRTNSLIICRADVCLLIASPPTVILTLGD